MAMIGLNYGENYIALVEVCSLLGLLVGSNGWMGLGLEESTINFDVLLHEVHFVLSNICCCYFL